ncbi:MAG: hypothetical protein V3S89_01775 [Desulfobacterales bacterium]
MADSIGTISQHHNPAGTQVQVQENAQKISNDKTGKQKQVGAPIPEAGNGQTDKVEISNRSAGDMAPSHSVEGSGEAVVLLEDTKGRLDERAANQDLGQIHNLEPGNLIDLLA